jgi:hypothetical protein
MLDVFLVLLNMLLAVLVRAVLAQFVQLHEDQHFSAARCLGITNNSSINFPHMVV